MANYSKIAVFINNTKKAYLLLYFDQIRKEFRNDKLLIFHILFFVFMRTDFDLENIENM